MNCNENLTRPCKLAALCVCRGVSMSKRKIPSSLFTLEEKNGVVIASVDDKNDISFQHTVLEMDPARIRSSRQSKDEILSFARFEANPNQPYYKSEKEYLLRDIENANQKIIEHIQEIRKSIKRMKSLKNHADMAEEVLQEITGNT